ncbi:unnamed protein product [Lupinus luteus]|uniref:Uncharacterized protein n=1 Tax=Lupinus luteus TaxID=3873 RepID=A0AAV1WXA6_LUPLU
MASFISSSSSSSKLCYNSQCKQFKSQFPKEGWKLCSGDQAQLCDRCGVARFSKTNLPVTEHKVDDVVKFTTIDPILKAILRRPHE